MTEIATIDWFGRWGTSVFFENTAIFHFSVVFFQKQIKFGKLETELIEKVIFAIF